MNLTDPGTLKAFLSRHGVSAAKGLGQHFLCSRSTVDSIVAAVEGCTGILEIGPGPGVLTGPLSLSATTLAIELDSRMVRALTESAPKADVRQADALKVDLASLLASLPEPRAVVSNMPYYITGPLLTRIAEVRTLWSRAVLMMQREVADRVTAEPRNRNRGSLSVYLQSQFEIRLVRHVHAGCFFPPPKVDSTVLELTPKGRSYDEAFFRLVRAGFAQPRKTLANNFSTGLRIPRDAVIRALEQADVDERARPQDLAVDQWEALSHIISALPPGS